MRFFHKQHDKLDLILKGQKEIMSSLTALQKSVADLTAAQAIEAQAQADEATAITTGIADIKSLMSNSGIPQADIDAATSAIEASVANIQTSAANMKTNTAALNAAVNPASPATVSPVKTGV